MAFGPSVARTGLFGLARFGTGLLHARSLRGLALFVRFVREGLRRCFLWRHVDEGGGARAGVESEVRGIAPDGACMG